MIRRCVLSGVFGALLALLSSCGYHVGGKADTLPKSIQTVTVLPFQTATIRYRLIDEFPRAIAQEFRTRSRFQVVQDQELADAIMTGVITSLSAAPTVYDPVSGKATSVEIFMSLNINLVERATGRVLYSRKGFNVREDYNVATDPHQFFDESTPALTRLTKEVAQSVVASVLEDF